MAEKNEKTTESDKTQRAPAKPSTLRPASTATTYMLSFHGDLWAIDRSRADALSRTLVTADVRAEDIEARTGPRPAKISGAIAVLPVMGVMVRRASLFSALFGGMSTERWGRAFDDLVANDNIGAIIGLFDTPGGVVAGTPELADKVFAARGSKPLIAVVDPMAASAGYYLAAAFDQVVMSRSSQVGWAGVIQAHEDTTAMNEMLGVEVTWFSGTQYKTEEFPEVPLTEGAKAEIQARVDEYQAMMDKDLARYRGVSLAAVRKNFGQGRGLRAKAAVAAGMADRIDTLEGTVARLGGQLAEVATVRAQAAQIAEEVTALQGMGESPKAETGETPDGEN